MSLPDGFAHKTQSLVGGKILQWLVAAAVAVAVVIAETETVIEMAAVVAE